MAAHLKSTAKRIIKSVHTSLAYELSSFQFLLTTTHALGQQWSQGCLWPRCTRYALDPNNKMFTGSDLDYFERRIGPHLPDPEETQCPPLAGRLGQTVESGGKRRIFAIYNYINQSKGFLGQFINGSWKS